MQADCSIRIPDLIIEDPGPDRGKCRRNCLIGRGNSNCLVPRRPYDEIAQAPPIVDRSRRIHLVSFDAESATLMLPVFSS